MSSSKVVYHIILIKTKSGTDPKQITEWAAVAKSNVGKIPGTTKTELSFKASHMADSLSLGLLASRIGTPEAPLPNSRTKGYDVGVVLIFESAKALEGFGKNPVHEL
jgi:hypothetical protein